MRRLLEIALALALLIAAAAAVVAIAGSSPGLAAVALVAFCLAFGAALGWRLAPVERLEELLRK